MSSGGCSPTTLWHNPRRPIRTCCPEQEQSCLEVSERIEQGFLCAYLHLCADRRILVSLRVVVNAVDLKQTRIGRMIRAVMPDDFTVLVHDVSPTSIGAGT